MKTSSDSIPTAETIEAEDIAARAAFEASRPSAEDIRAKFDSSWLIWEEDTTEDAEQVEAEARQ